MASGPITSCQVDGETMESVRDFIFLDSKITSDGDCSHEIKRCLLLGRKAMTHLDSIWKSRHNTNKDLSSQGYGFYNSHIWIWQLDHKENWVPKNWCFWTVVLEKTFFKYKFIYFNCRLITLQYCIGEDSWESLGLQRDPTSPSWRKSVLSIHWKDCCWSWSSNTLAAWCEELTHWKRPWSWEWLKAGGEGDDRGWGG